MSVGTSVITYFTDFTYPQRLLSARSWAALVRSKRNGIVRRFLRSINQVWKSPPAYPVTIANVVALTGFFPRGVLPMSSRISANSDSSGAALESTMLQNAGVFSGGDFESNFEMSRS